FGDTPDDLTIVQDGLARSFQRDPATGVYHGAAGDFATVAPHHGADVPGGYDLRESDGTVTVFSTQIPPAGAALPVRLAFAYLQDPRGNRLSLESRSTLSINGVPQDYTLHHSSGASLEVDRTQTGLITSVVEKIGGQPTGRQAAYTYDAAGLHLLSVTTSAGTTQYAYVTGQGAA